MTSNELIKYFNRIFGIDKDWPETFEVDVETYANCCQSVFNHKIDSIDDDDNITVDYKDFYSINITIGRNKGLMFKNVELILMKEK